MLSQTDNDLVVFLAGGAGCSLDSSPKKNWVENEGGLPNYICQIAKSVMKSGKSKSSAIAIAVSRVKKWAAGGDGVEADTKAKAAAALAQWEKMKAKAKGGKLVRASREDGTDYLISLSADTSFNVDSVRQAWQAQQAAARKAARDVARAAGQDPYGDTVESYPYSYIRELWTDHIIVEIEGTRGQKLASIPFTVSDGSPTFGTPKAVEMQYVEVKDAKEQFTDNEKALLSDVFEKRTPDSRIADLMELAARIQG